MASSTGQPGQDDPLVADGVLQSLVDAAPIAIAAAGEDGKVLVWNAAAERLFGWSADQAVGRFMPGIPGDQRREFLELRDRVLAGGAVTGLETVRVREDGTTFAARIWAAPLRDGDDRIQGLILVTADNSRRSRARAEKRDAQRSRQEVALQAVGRLAAGFAHDFNNLLTGIMGHADLLLEGEEDAAARDASLAAIRESAQYAVFLTRQLLAYASQQIFRPVVMEANAVIERNRGLIADAAGPDMSVRYSLEAEGRVRVDPSQMEEVLRNLTANARDACEGDGTLEIRSYDAVISEVMARTFAEGVEAGPFVVFSVKDDGRGMESTTVDKVFEPFFTTKKPGAGTGLGLSTVYGIVRQSGGHIRIDSTPRGGTEVLIHLPRVRESSSD